MFDTDSPNIAAVRDSETDYTLCGADGLVVSPAAEDSLHAKFTVLNEGQNPNSHGQQVVAINYELANSEISRDVDPITVTPESGQDVTDTATVAPGTDANLRVRRARRSAELPEKGEPCGPIWRHMECRAGVQQPERR